MIEENRRIFQKEVAIKMLQKDINVLKTLYEKQERSQ